MIGTENRVLEKMRAEAPVWLQIPPARRQVLHDLPNPARHRRRQQRAFDLQRRWGFIGVGAGQVRLGGLGNVRHHVDRAVGKFPDRCLPAQHHRVGAVEDRVGHVAHFRPRRRGVVDHALEHLRRDDHRLADGLASTNEVFLDDRHIGDVHLHAQIAAGDHQAIGTLGSRRCRRSPRSFQFSR